MRTEMQNYMRHRRGGKPTPDWKALAHDFTRHALLPLCTVCGHGEAHAVHHGGDLFWGLPPIPTQETR